MIALIPLLLFLSASFSGSETAIFSLSKLHLSILAQKDRKLLSAIKNPDGLLFAILLGNTFVNFLTTSIITISLAKAIGGWAVPIATASVTVLILVFGEILPKSFAVAYPYTVIKIFFPVVYLFYLILYPFSKLFNSLIPQTSENEHIAEDINESDVAFIQGLELSQALTSGEISTPRKDIQALSEEELLKENPQIPSFRRIPVFKKTKDHIKGYVLFSELLKNTKFRAKRTRIHRKIDFVAYTEHLKNVTETMEKAPMIFVLDEFGGTQGLITIANLMDIFRPFKKKRNILPASLEIWKAEKILGISLPEECDTLLELFTENDTFKAGGITLKAIKDRHGKTSWVIVR